jgi:hypothetical protein
VDAIIGEVNDATKDVYPPTLPGAPMGVLLFETRFKAATAHSLAGW